MALLLGEKDNFVQMVVEAIAKDPEAFQIIVDKIECKIGNKFYSFPLS